MMLMRVSFCCPCAQLFQVRSLVKGCRSIEELHLGGCVQLTDDAVVELSFALGSAASSSRGDGGFEIKPASLRVLDLQVRRFLLLC